MVGVGCPTHILNNCFYHGVNHMSLDLESIIYKIYQHFSIYIVIYSCQMYLHCTIPVLPIWMDHFIAEFKCFDWMLLFEIKEWDNVKRCMRYLAEKNVDIDGAKLFDQFQNLCKFV